MRCGIVGVFTFIPSFCDDHTVPHDDCSDGNFTTIGSLTGKTECDVHRVEFDRTDHGGGGGIRTHGGLHLTRFPSVPIRPLSHPSKDDADAYQFRVEAIGEGRLTSWR